MQSDRAKHERGAKGKAARIHGHRLPCMAQVQLEPLGVLHEPRSSESFQEASEVGSLESGKQHALFLAFV